MTGNFWGLVGTRVASGSGTPNKVLGMKTGEVIKLYDPPPASVVPIGEYVTPTGTANRAGFDITKMDELTDEADFRVEVEKLARCVIAMITDLKTRGDITTPA